MANNAGRKLVGDEDKYNNYFSWLGLDNRFGDLSLFLNDDDFRELHEIFQLWQTSGCRCSVSRKPKCYMDREDW